VPYHITPADIKKNINERLKLGPITIKYVDQNLVKMIYRERLVFSQTKTAKVGSAVASDATGRY